MTDGARILWDVVEEHLDEAEFLFEQWSRAVVAPDYTWRDVERTWGERLRAHLDGLVIAGEPAAERLLVPALSDDDAEVFRVGAAALALLETPGAESVWRVWTSLANAERDSARWAGVVRALEASSRAGLDDALRDAVYQSEGPAQWALVHVLAARGVDAGPVVEALLRMPDPAAQEAGLRAVVLRGEDTLWPQVDALLDARDRGVRMAAIEAAMTWGRWVGWCRCVEASRRGEAEALAWVGMLGGRDCVDELAFIADAVEALPTRYAALRALGYTGDRRAAEVCMRWMHHDDAKTAAVAADAFGAITGIDACCEGYAAKEGDGKTENGDGELPPLEDDLAEELTPDEDDALTAPDVGRFVAWWGEKSGGLATKERYVRGVRAGSAEMVAGMGTWPMRCAQWLRRDVRARSLGAVAAQGPRVGGRAPWRALEGVAETVWKRAVVWR